MAGEVHTLEQVLKIGGPVDEANMGYVREIVVDDRLQLPAFMTITFDDIPGDLLEKLNAKIGAPVEYSSTPVGESAPVVLFKGEITSLEANYVQTGAQVVVRAHDLLHRMQQGRHTEAYLNTKDSEIVNKVAGRNGVPMGKMDTTSTVYEHVTQANTSDWDFLKARARKIGFELAMVEGKLEFRKPTPAAEAPSAGTLNSENPKQLVYNAELIEFHPRLTAGSQVKAISVRSWDPKAKKEIVERASAATKTVKIEDEPDTVAAQAKEKEPYVSVNIPVHDSSSASGLAQAIAEELGSAFFEADGIAIGDPRLKAGSAVSISGVGAKFAGRHVLSHVRHVFDPEYGYRTHFEISGRQERSLLGLASMGHTNGVVSQGGQPIFGLVVGVVTNVKDPDGQGRVKVTYPWLAPKTGQGAFESWWARVAHFGAGKKRGGLFLPEVDDEVLVGFEHGDINRPYVIGGLYNGMDEPDVGKPLKDLVAKGDIARRGITSRKGHRLIFIDDDETPGIEFRTSDEKLKIEFKVKEKELRITGDAKVIVTAQQELLLESKKDLNIKAAGNIKLEGQGGVEMKSSASFKVQGSQTEVKGSAQLALSGGVVKIN